MNNLRLSLMTGLVLLAAIVLFTMNFSSYSPGFQQGKTLSSDEVRGMAVEHRSVLYVLNYDQQKQMIDWINQSVVVKEPLPPAQDPSIGAKKIVIYLFDEQPSIELIPLKYDADGNLLFSYQGKLKRETSGGRLKKFLSTTYDN